ncbi:MAG: hypothetical protein AAGE52_23925 [Myxococcota bacterium]
MSGVPLTILPADREEAFLKALVTQDLLTEEEAQYVRSYRRGARPPIGEMALRRRHLCAKQVASVLRDQASSKERFGEIATRLGYCSEGLIAHLLLEQIDATPAVASVVVELGLLTPEVCEAARIVFDRSQEQKDSGTYRRDTVPDMEPLGKASGES